MCIPHSYRMCRFVDVRICRHARSLSVIDIAEGFNFPFDVVKGRCIRTRVVIFALKFATPARVFINTLAI